MNDVLLSLDYEIAGYVYELHELQQVIKELAADPEADPIYMQEVGDRYMQLCDKLRITFECYFKEEENLYGNVRQFNSYRKIYKQLVD